MDVLINVVGQQLKTVTTLKPFVESQQFVRFVFNFDKSWDDLTISAQFIQDEAYGGLLDAEKSIYLPSEIKPGKCMLVLLGADGGDVRATTNYLELTVSKYMGSNEASGIYVTESVYQILVNAMDGINMTQEQYLNILMQDVAAIMERYKEDGVFDHIEIDDHSISRIKVDADFEATLDRADRALLEVPDNSVTRDKVDDDIRSVLNAVDNLDLTIPDHSISRDKVDADFEATLDRADTAMQVEDGSIAKSQLEQSVQTSLELADSAMQEIDDGSIHRSMMDASLGETLQKADESMSEIPNGYIARSMVDADFEATLAKADTAMQEIADGQVARIKVAGDVESLLTKIENSFEIVDELPEEGNEDTDYYMLNETGAYSHYKWVNGEYVTVGSSSSTVVVDELPENPVQSIDYILINNGEYQYYKYIDDEWHMIAGGSAEVVEELPQSGSSTKDYYLENSNGKYLHYRWIDGEFKQIGSDAYSRAEVDAMIAPFSTLSGQVASNTEKVGTIESNLTTVNNTIGDIQQTLNNLDTEGYRYYATYGKAEIAGQETDNVYQLYEVKDEQAEVVSQFVIQGGGGGGQSATDLQVTRVTPSPLIVTTSDKVELVFTYSSVDGGGGEVDGTYRWKLGNSVIATGACVQGTNTFDATEFCTIGTQKFTLSVADEGGSTAVRTFTVQKVDVRIESSFNDRYTVEIGRPVSFTYTPYGAISKTVHFKINGVEDTFDTAASGVLSSYNIPAKPHGSYLVEAWITATVNSTPIETNHIYKDIIWYDPTMDEHGQYQNPVIGCIYRNDYYGKVTARQYDTTPIVFNVFDPTTNYPIVNRYVDGELVGTDTLSTSQSTWNYKSETVGEHTLMIECRGTTVTIVMNIEELGIDVSPVTGGLELDFNPVGITNSSENRIWHNDNYHMTVSENFDWANGGYKTDENGDTYFLVKAGTDVTFDYQMFAGGLEHNPSNTGAEMKIVFMTENVQDANAIWMTNAETTTTTVDDVTTVTNVGLQMSVHEGWLKTNKASNTDVDVGEGDSADTVAATNTYLYMPYSEEDIIEMDINIDVLNREDDTAQAFVMSYEDGVPSKAYVYDATDRFYQYTPQPIKIGSAYCDVRIYRMKIYSASLSTEGIMRNFIADSRDSTTMLNRYDRNSIYYNRETNKYTPYSGEGILDPEKLAQVIPDVKVLMLETDHFTTSKKTFVKSSLRCIHAPGGKVYPGDEYYDNWLFEKGWHSGQGTTSDNYGNAGRNIDFLFNCDGVHNPSDKIKEPEADYISQVTLGYNTENAHTEVCDDWKGTDGKVTLTRTSVPNNYFNLKVNIASSENVNNALFQKRYSDFLPYISPAKRRDSRIKNDMEFVPAIVFLKETNPDVSTHNEFLDTEWHFYALGNLGDSKKTDYTRAYDPEDMSEFTIEISDNTKNNATFQTGVYDTGDGTLAYESFHLVKTLDKDGELVVTPVPDVTVNRHVYPVPKDQQDALLFSTGTITVENNTGDSQYDGDETGYLNMRMWCLYNEDFDGDHSFEPRYACCGDYRDGKLVNDTTGHGKQQVKKNNEVWRAFYKWAITTTDQEFVNELDQWCVRSAVEFFYAFTHYYTMMDNRAKNTFWHFAKTGEFRKVTKPYKELLGVYYELINDEYVLTEDTEVDAEKDYYTEHAFDMWMYDGDTAIGINNNGELVIPYGKEDTDYNIDGQPNSGYVFNGATSVFWCRLRDLLQSEIRNTYNAVTSECFSATNLINQFDTFQDCYPEEIWRLDIQRKYIRTFTGESVDNSKPKHDVQYLRDMMQGRKKYQRRQWVRDQEIYFGTMNLMNTVVGDNNRITFRCFTPTGDVAVAPDYTLRMIPYQDMYLSVMFGNGGTQQVRAKAGLEYTIECPLSTMDDTQVTIYGANRIQALNDLSACYIAANNFSMATKLRKLVLGNTTPGYSNSRLISLTLGSNKLLEELDIRNCSNLTGAINLAQCSNLLRLYAEGTKITGATFATNGKVQLIHLPSTINTLVMRNLNNLEDFQCSLDYLESLTLQGGTLDGYALVADTVDTLQVAYLYDVDWQVPTTAVLNSLLNMYYSLITGQIYINGAVRLRELEQYDAKWTDLEVTYNPEYLVEQYVATYVNTDGTELYQAYVDRGATPPDPVAEGWISAPTRESTAQYSFTFSGWDGLTDVMLSPRTIYAKYDSTLRTYTVTWYSRAAVPLKTVQAEYGSEVTYGNELPTRTDEEIALMYNVFLGWDKSTGYITGDTDVYAIWDRKSLPSTSKELKDMSVAEIYGLGQAASIDINNYLSLKDYIDIQVGNDFNFSNVDSELLAENQWFDGTNYIDTGVQLFAEDSPSFTLAMDFEYYGTDSNTTMASCFDEDGSEGFRLRYSNGPNIQWGDKAQPVGSTTRRGMCVLRHIKGSNSLFIYIHNIGSNYYDVNTTSVELVRTRATSTDTTLVLGAMKYADNAYDYFVNGWLHWCKIWYDDLGDANAKELAAWPHETWRAEFTAGTNRYRIAGKTQYAKMSFILNNLLDYTFRMTNTSSNAGGWSESAMRTFVNNRVLKALPIGWRSILKKVRVASSAGNLSSEILYSEDYLYLPCYTEVSGNQNDPYSSEGKYIEWFTSNISRLKFKAQIIPENAQYFQGNTDPSSIASNNVKMGDIWFDNTRYTGYMYIPASIASKHKYSAGAYEHSQAADGGLWYSAMQWWERSPSIDYEDYFLYVANYGYPSSPNNGTVGFGVDIGFSV